MLALPARFIANTRSGRAARALPLVRRYAAARDAEIVLTERTRHAFELARAALADGVRTVIAVGGDGTLNEVASALVGTDAILGLVPCGSGDGLGRHLRIHGSIERALALLDDGEIRLVDVGLANEHPFFTAAGLGFEAEIAARFNRLARRGFGRYLTTSIGALRMWKPERYRIFHDGAAEEVEAFTVAVANADQYGNGARIAPNASADDGLLDLTAVLPITVLNAVPLAIRLFAGRLGDNCGVVMRQSTAFVIERPAPGPFHTDGELREGGTRIEFVIRPKSLRIVAPPVRGTDRVLQSKNPPATP